MWTKVDTRRPLIVVLIALSALAWLALGWWEQSPHSRYLDHHNLDAVTGNPGLMPLFVAGWVVMTIAMMLPTRLPLITLFDTITRQRPNHTRLVMLLGGGYLAAWTLFGAVVYASDYVLHQIMGHVHWLEGNAWLLSAGALMLAGCCWSLMLLMFAIGAGSLGWMLVLGAVMAAEKNLPWGARMSRPLGMVLLIGGVAILIVGAP